MTNARLLSVEVERFKSYEAATRIDLAPLTVIVGRNNSGKSTLIQALLLLEQTLAHPRADVPVHLEGPVDALTLRELTSFGWQKKAGERIAGPRVCVRWRSVVDGHKPLDTELCLSVSEEQGRMVLDQVTLISTSDEGERHTLDVTCSGGRWRCAWNDRFCEHIAVELDHFVPHLVLDRRQRDPSHIERALYKNYLLLFSQPLDDLKALLKGFLYLGSTRTLPPMLHRPSSAPLSDVGISGEYAGQLVHSRQSDVVHYVPPLQVRDSEVELPTTVLGRRFIDAVNDVLTGLGVDTSLAIEEIPNIGFRLFFGDVSLPHVGRGLIDLLPIIELGLIADPRRFKGTVGEEGIEAYRDGTGYSHFALEAPEGQLHPEVQTRLAHWMVALAMVNRRIIVETHSDHFVCGLRGLLAHARPGSELAQWLRENVSIVEVEQNAEGRSRIHASGLTPDGMVSER